MPEAGPRQSMSDTVYQSVGAHILNPDGRLGNLPMTPHFARLRLVGYPSLFRMIT
jgi:hypothetical protein